MVEHADEDSATQAMAVRQLKISGTQDGKEGLAMIGASPQQDRT
jgi:hypothetical protein